MRFINVNALKRCTCECKHNTSIIGILLLEKKLFFVSRNTCTMNVRGTLSPGCNLAEMGTLRQNAVDPWKKETSHKESRYKFASCTLTHYPHHQIHRRRNPTTAETKTLTFKSITPRFLHSARRNPFCAKCSLQSAPKPHNSTRTTSTLIYIPRAKQSIFFVRKAISIIEKYEIVLNIEKSLWHQLMMINLPHFEN